MAGLVVKSSDGALHQFPTCVSFMATAAGAHLIVQVFEMEDSKGPAKAAFFDPIWIKDRPED